MLTGTSFLDPSLLVVLQKRFSNLIDSRWNQSTSNTHGRKELESASILILYGSQTGTTQAFGYQLKKRLDQWKKILEVELDIDISSIAEFGRSDNKSDSDRKNDLSRHSNSELSSIARFEDIINYDFIIICISTWTDGKPPKHSIDLINCLEELASDFRIPRNYFANLGVAIIGFGNREYPKFCTPAIGITAKFRRLGADFLLPLFKVDEAIDTEKQENQWRDELEVQIAKRLQARLVSEKQHQLHPSFNKCCETSNGSCSATDRCCSTKATIQETTILDNDDHSDESSWSDSEDTVNIDTCGTNETYQDVEDFIKEDEKSPLEKKRMLTDRQQKQLEKEGYKIVGSHSAVKLCRWTKSQLRGRGGCYKHTFYGIQSHQCMEATPSLACANKCVFCWRHHKNPVGTSWKWEMDSPNEILDGILGHHYKMIKQLKGVSGVQKDRFENAATKIRHCALSLVGEPIMYPEINALLQAMHREFISTFLVTNAQFPDEMKRLCPVTQLYVSVDAASKDALKAVDRPLFSDFWDRFLKSLDVIRHIPQRTVFRLTLIKKYNMEDAVAFGRLILQGIPDLIEIKAVTYCGTNPGSNDITMKDIPWHDEVVSYARAILDSSFGLQQNYSIACEHRHSCCILIAHKKFYINDQWHTWINYDKFFELANSNLPFTSLDYCSQTPEWAVYGSDMQGFDPNDTRIYIKGRKFREQRDQQFKDDKTNHDKTNHDKTNHDKTNHDKTNHDKTNHDKTNHDKTNHDKTNHDNTNHDNTNHDNTNHDNTNHDNNHNNNDNNHNNDHNKLF